MNAALQQRLKSGDTNLRHEAIDELGHSTPTEDAFTSLVYIASGYRRRFFWHYSFEDQVHAISAIMHLKNENGGLFLKKFFELRMELEQAPLSGTALEADFSYPPATVHYFFPKATGDLGHRLQWKEEYEGGWSEGAYGSRPLTVERDEEAQRIRERVLRNIPKQFFPKVSGHDEIAWDSKMPEHVKQYIFQT